MSPMSAPPDSTLPGSASGSTSPARARSGDVARRCLVIDDERDTAEVLSYHLRRLGYSTTLAPNGRIGSELLGHGPWDLVVIDVVLPDVDGRDLVRPTHDLDPRPEVILTSVLHVEDLAGSTADAVLAKPFRGVDVTRAVQTARKAA